MRTLTNAVERDRVHHAYLFVGSRGTGKTSMAKILAACLNCVHGPTVDAVRRLRLVRLDRRGELARRDRDGRGVVELGRRHPRAARLGRLRAGVGAPEDLHPRRGAHALDGGLERVPQDARGAAAEHRLRARDDRGRRRCCRRSSTAATASTSSARPPSRSPPWSSASASAESITIGPEAVAVLARHASGSFRDALGTLEQLQTYAGAAIALADVLAVLGISDAELLFRALDAIAARRSARRAGGGRRRGRRRPRPGGLHPRARDARARAAGRADAGRRRPARAEPDARARRAARRRRPPR